MASTIWRIIRWPVMFLIFLASGVVFLVGLAQSVGYNGTTHLRAVKPSDIEWKNFQNLFSSDGKKGAPYYWSNKEPVVSADTVKFDKRVIQSLTYLAQKSQYKCGWDGTHEKIGLLVKDTPLTDLSYPSTNLPPPSTLERGLGVRIVGADRIKCTELCQDEPPKSFHAPGYDIKFDLSIIYQPTDLVQPNCRVLCAVDYYPLNPLDVPVEQIIVPNVKEDLKKFDPGIFAYEEISIKARQAAVYKMAQLAYELFQIDAPGCQNSKGNQGGQRTIPLTIIFPQWVVSSLGDTWPDFLEMARVKIPNNFQVGSPTAGLSYDPLLNQQGLHINY